MLSKIREVSCKYNAFVNEYMIVNVVCKLSFSVPSSYKHGLEISKCAGDTNKDCHNGTCRTMVLQWHKATQK